MEKVSRVNIGEILSAIAKYKGMSQQQIADECGVSRISINRFFRGHTEVKAGDFVDVCKVLGIDVLGQIRSELLNRTRGCGAVQGPESRIETIGPLHGREKLLDRGRANDSGGDLAVASNVGEKSEGLSEKHAAIQNSAQAKGPGAIT